MRLILFVGLCFLASMAQAQSVYQLLYVQESIKTNNKTLEIGRYYHENTVVEMAGKLAILYDTTKKELASIRTDRPDAIAKLRIPVRVEGYKCCVSPFTSFFAHNKRPYPVLYPNTIFELTNTDALKFPAPLQLAYQFWDTKEKKFRMRLAPLEGKDKNMLNVGKIVEYMMSIENKDVLEPFFFYAYDSQDIKNHKLIGERSLQIIDAEQLKAQIAPFVKILQTRYSKPDKESKEQILALLSDFVHEISGYPDEVHFKKWLKEHFNLDF